jgi:predicted MFS family arabinose efflux permease
LRGDSFATLRLCESYKKEAIVERTRAWLGTPAGRGFVMMMVTTAAVGFAMSAQQNVVANYFGEVLGMAGPQFGYITAIREIPGFLLIFATMLFYRVPLPKLTAGALLLLAVGYGLFGVSWSFWSVAPWVILSSMGYHTWLQYQYALGMSLTTENKAGSILGRISAMHNAGGLVAMLVVMAGFYFGWLGFVSTFALCGLMALIGAVAIVAFPNMHNGVLEAKPRQRERLVLRRDYRYFYWLNLLDGGRQQIFFSFGLWVLVSHYQLSVPVISAILITVLALNVLTGAWVGRLFDRYGERPMLMVANVGYLVALAGYGLIDNVVVAVACYVVYMFIFPLSWIGASTYLRKVAVVSEIAPSLAMGLTLQHVAAVAVPLATGYILNFVGYQVPFLVACAFSVLTFFVTQRLDPQGQKSPLRVQEDAVRAAAGAD